MARSEAHNNYVISEKIASRLSGIINLSCANLYSGKYLQEVEGQYYLIFDFKEGKPLRQSEITSEHAYKIGAVVAKIHSTDFSGLNIINDNTTDSRIFDWVSFRDMGKERDAAWSSLLSTNIDKLSILAQKMNESYTELSTNEIICHGDLDSKNVLWNGNDPVIIDWESAWFYNPYHDFLDTALYWSQNEDMALDYMRFHRLLTVTLFGGHIYV